MGLDDTTRLSCLDSSTVIDLLDPQSARNEAVRRGVLQAKNDVLCISDLVRPEVSVGPFKRGVDNELRRLHTVLQGLTRLEIPEEVYLDAARLRADHGLKTADAFHIATAQYLLPRVLDERPATDQTARRNDVPNVLSVGLRQEIGHG